MPLNVVIAINGRPLENIRISRMEEFKGSDRWHEYMIQVEGYPEGYATYMHLYSEGAQECVRRGLEALNKRRNKQ